MSLSTLDLAIVAVYAAVLILVALLVSRERAGRQKNTQDYFLAGKALPWWAIGASLIAANISAEQIIGMSGSGYAIGMAIASYEWMAAITLVIVGKFFLPIFLKRGIYTMPQFLDSRFGPSVKYVMSVFWLALYTVVNLTTVLWLGATAINTLTGLDMFYGMLALAAFATAYSIYGGLKAVALTDIIQVVMLVFGGILITIVSLDKVGGGGGAVAGFETLLETLPSRFDMILDKATRPEDYQNLPGIGVLIGGMWIMNLSYWGFNQYIIQRALGAKDVREAQAGVIFAAFLKLIVPFIVVIPGIAAVILAPDLEKPDQAYPTMMAFAPVGVRGLIFAALIAAIVSSIGSMMNSISTIFTMDVYKPLLASAASEHRLVFIGRIVSVSALIIALFLARPLLGQSGQVFQNIQNWTGFFTPGVVAIFFLGMFWRRATELGGLVAVVSSVIMSFAWPHLFPEMPFMDRVGVVFLICVALGVAFSFLQKPPSAEKSVDLGGVSFKTGPGFNLGAVIIVACLIVLYGVWW